MYIYVANETNDDINVYFDNLTITHTGLQVVEHTDYYPYGMVMRKDSSQGQGVYSRYRYGFNGQERDTNLGGGTHYDYGFRIYKPSIGKFLSVDPLTKSYPMLTPYQFASNRPIDGIDLDGLEYLNSTSVYSEGIGVAAGITVGFNLAISQGTARDMIGRTYYKAYSLIGGPANQDLEEGSRDPKVIIGAEVGADIGFRVAYDKPTFAQAAKAFNLSFGTVSAKFGIGGSIQFGEGTFGVRVSVGIGGSFKTGGQETIYESISLTYGEADKVGSSWSVGNQEAKIVDGKVVGYSGEVYSNGKSTGVTVFSGSSEIKTTQDDGSIKTTYESTGLWKSSDYSTAEQEY